MAQHCLIENGEWHHVLPKGSIGISEGLTKVGVKEKGDNSSRSKVVHFCDDGLVVSMPSYKILLVGAVDDDDDDDAVEMI